MQRAGFAIIAAALSMAAAPPPDGVVIATRFEADRVSVEMPAPDGGAPLKLLTDSGGGALILTRASAIRLGLDLTPETDKEALGELGPDTQVGPINAFVSAHWPAVPGGARFTVVGETSPMKGWPGLGDGILGRQWFSGHTWTWDYPRQRLTLRPVGWTPATSAHPLPITFRTDATGRRTGDFARMTVSVDGEALPMLFDTGATTILNPAALTALNDGGPALRSTSMVAHGVFERWIAHHPDWPVITDAQLGTHARMIRVSSVEIAGWTTGPVWFTERSDQTFHQFMSSMMSGLVEGSIGGNAFHDRVVTLDYPGARAWVE